jgi:hypothetical protein
MPEHLVESDTRDVLGLLVDAQCACPDVDVGEPYQLVELRVRGVVEVDLQGDAVAVLVGGPAVVDRWTVLRRQSQKFVHRAVDAVHAQVGRDPVGDLVPLAVAVGAIGEDVDESRGHDKAGGVQGRGADQWIQADPGDGVAVDSDMGHRIEAGLGIDDPSACNDDVVYPAVLGHLRGAQRGLDVRYACRGCRRHGRWSGYGRQRGRAGGPRRVGGRR